MFIREVANGHDGWMDGWKKAFSARHLASFDELAEELYHARELKPNSCQNTFNYLLDILRRYPERCYRCGFMLLLTEYVTRFYYSRTTMTFPIALLNIFKVGFTYGLFIDAFKLTS